MGITLRGTTWHFKRRVPKRYQSVETKSEIWKSLRTDSRNTAEAKAVQYWSETIAGWEAKLANRGEDAEARFRSAQKLAEIQGFPFQTATTLADGPLDQILERVEASRDSQGQFDAEIGAALLGAVKEPDLMLSGLVERAEKLAKYDNRYKNPEQMRLWRNPRKRAVANLIEAIGGDRPVVQVSSLEARLHRKFWKQKISKEGLSNNTANKDFNYLSGMLSRFYDDLDYED